MSLAERLAAVESRIARACENAGRQRAEVTLVAVSKGHPAEQLRAAYALGIRDFGENYAQELESKARDLADLADLRFHFIGHLQSNKAKLIVQHAWCMHTVDTASLARELDRRASALAKTLPVLAEVNVGGEAQKHGVMPGELAELVAAIDAAPNLKLLGLMTIPPDDDARTRAAFDSLSVLRKLHGGESRLPWLSMGMSDDLEVAIAMGATHIRVGTAIFGPRALRA
jgi:PLP dependent protein